MGRTASSSVARSIVETLNTDVFEPWMSTRNRNFFSSTVVNLFWLKMSSWLKLK